MKMLDVPKSGSMGAVTASHNRAGQYLRNRRTPVSPTRTPKQGIQRGRFGSVSAAWQSLAGDVQSAWTAFAAGYPVVDSLGQSIVLTGHQYFVGVNSALLAAGQAIINTVPTNTTIPPINSPNIFADGNGNLIVSVAGVTTGDWNLIGLSKVLSNGRNFNKQFSQFAVASDTNNVLDVSDAYATQYGAPIAGRKIFGRFKEVNSSGMQGPDLILQVPVVASSLTVTPTTTNAISGTVVSTIAGSGTAVQELWQEVGVPGQFELFDEEAGVAGVATFVAATPGSRTFTRQHTGSEYGPRSEVFTAF